MQKLETSSLSIEESKINYAKQGKLLKKGMGMVFGQIRPWSERTFLLDVNQKLIYYKDKDMKNEINLKGAFIRHLDKNEADGKNNAFEISNISGMAFPRGNILVLAATSSHEAKEWVQCLQAAVSSTIRERIDIGPGYVKLTDLKVRNPNEVIDIKELKEKRRSHELKKKKQQQETKEVPKFNVNESYVSFGPSVADTF